VNRLTVEKEDVVNNCEVILTPYSLVLGHPLFLLRCSEAIHIEGLANGRTKETTPSAVRLEPIVHRLQTPSFLPIKLSWTYSNTTEYRTLLPVRLNNQAALGRYYDHLLLSMTQ